MKYHRIYLLLLFYYLLTIIPCLAQESNKSQYEQMLEEMNDQSLPLVNIIVDVDSLSSTYYRGAIEFSEYNQNRDSVVKKQYPCDLRFRGGAAQLFEKKSFALKLKYDNGDSWDTNLFGIRKESSWILDAMSVDRIRMRNRLCFDVWNEFSKTPYQTKFDGRNGTKGIFVEVFINGNYNGLYCLTDKINRELLNLRSPSIINDSTSLTRGVLYKGYQWQDVDGEATDIHLLYYKEDKTDSRTWNAWELQHPEDYPSHETWQPLMELIDFCSDDNPSAVFNREWKTFFDPDNLVDYMVFTLALNVGDNAYKNTFLSTQDITMGHLFIITPWDMDMSLGGFWNGSYDESLANIHRYDGIAPYNRLFTGNVDGFYNMVKGKWEALRHYVFSTNNVFRKMDYYAKQFLQSGAWERECKRWSGNPVPLKVDINEELNYVKSWYIRNLTSLNNQFAGTDIQHITNIETINNVYTIDGRRVNSRDRNNLSKGIYIINGRKYIVH